MLSSAFNQRRLVGLLSALTLLLTQGAEICAEGQSAIPLNGDWSLALDPQHQGVADKLGSPQAAAKFVRTAQLPGSLAAQEIGDPISLATPWVGQWEISGFHKLDKFAPYRPPHEIKLPFWLTPSTSYVGPAWYRKIITIPSGWSQGRVVLHLERCHCTTQVWVHGKVVGKAESLSVPHEFNLTSFATPGEHHMVICVDNSQHINLGPNSHSVSDHTQGNWNGIIGAVELRTTPASWIDDLRLDCRGPANTLQGHVSIGNQTDAPVEGTLTLRVQRRDEPDESARSISMAHVAPAASVGKATTIELPLGAEAAKWDEFAPHLYDVEVCWTLKGQPPEKAHRLERQFGIRSITTANRQIVINGQPRFLRGTLDCCVFPLTGHPPSDIAEWKRIFSICREYGLNHIRFHSYCPPEAAFVAGDELGMYLQIECASWANQGVELGSGQPVDGFVRREARRILKTYGDHPSFVMLAYGNEPEGKNKEGFLKQWIKTCRKTDNRRIYTGGSGWPTIDSNQFHVTPAPRIHQWGDELKSRINSQPPETVSDYREFIAKHPSPVVAHEIGQWCVFPNLAERQKYTGHFKAKNFDIFADQLAAIGRLEQAEDFFLASGKLQTLCYKEEIESALRTPGYAGFQLLGLSDFTGQGTALVGVLDPFWDPKPYVNAREFARFCGPIVPLARLKQRTFTSAEILQAELELANFGPRDLAPARLQWKVQVAQTQQVIASGEVSKLVARGSLKSVGQISVPLLSAPAPAKLQLIVTVADSEIKNDWDLWVYATGPAATADNIFVTSRWDNAARQQLANGGKVLLTLPADSVKTDQVLGFSSIFWNTAWTGGQPPHTLGILCQPEHPLFRVFPTESHSNWQWWELINGGAALDLTKACPHVQPLVQVVPDWANPRVLALAFEAQVGLGKLLVTSANVTVDQERRPAARQFLASLHSYMASESFQPQATLTIEQIQALIK